MDDYSSTKFDYWASGLLVASTLVNPPQPQTTESCIDLQAYATTQAPEREDILNVGGFSDARVQRRGLVPERRRRPVRGRGRSD